MDNRVVREKTIRDLQQTFLDHKHEVEMLRERLVGDFTNIMSRSNVRNLSPADLILIDDEITTWLNENEGLRELCVLYDEWYYIYIRGLFVERETGKKSKTNV